MRILVAGATGLIGNLALRQALADPTVTQVSAIGRRALAVTDAKLRQVPWDFADPAAVAGALPPADAALCALGTTIAKAGSRRAFHAIDHDAVLAFARLAKARGVRHFAVVSSVGASARAGNFYLATKGRMEDSLQALGFERLSILRPSLLLGERDETRRGEQIGSLLSGLIAPLLAGPLRRYRPIAAASVATALLQTVLRADSAGGILHYDDMLRLAA